MPRDYLQACLSNFNSARLETKAVVHNLIRHSSRASESASLFLQLPDVVLAAFPKSASRGRLLLEPAAETRML